MRAKVNGNSKNQTRSWFSKVIRKIDKFCAKGDRRAQLIKFKVKKKTWKVTKLPTTSIGPLGSSLQTYFKKNSGQSKKKLSS